MRGWGQKEHLTLVMVSKAFIGKGGEHLQLTDGHWARNVTVPRGEEYREGEPVRVWGGSSPPKKALMGEHPGAGVGELYTQGWQNTGGLEAKYSQSKVNSILEATAAQGS